MDLGHGINGVTTQYLRFATSNNYRTIILDISNERSETVDSKSKRSNWLKNVCHSKYLIENSVFLALKYYKKNIFFSKNYFNRLKFMIFRWDFCF